MSSTREIRERINSIQSTMKITNAMYMISSTKLNSARESLRKTEPYFIALQAMFDRVKRHMPADYEHPYLDTRTHVPGEDLRRAVICVTADKGLAGSYNSNVIKMTMNEVRPDSNDMLYTIGEVGRHYFESHGVNIDGSFRYTAQKPTLGRARKIGITMLDLFTRHEVDQVFLIYTRVRNAMEYEPQMIQLLPLVHLPGMREQLAAAGVLGGADDETAGLPPDGKEQAGPGAAADAAAPAGSGSAQTPVSQNMIADLGGVFTENFRMEPDPGALLDNIVPDFVTGFIYCALVESYTAEHNARMMAMDAANRNGEKLLAELKLAYNRERQAAITQEITEVAAGARAQARHGTEN